MHSDRELRNAAAWAVRALGSAAATPEILARLPALSQDQNGTRWDAGVGAVRALGSAAATPEVLARLAALLQDEEGHVRAAAAGAVAAFGRAAGAPEVRARLADLLQDEDGGVRRAAAGGMQLFTQLGVRVFAQRRWFRRTLYRPCSVKELAQQPIAEDVTPPGPVPGRSRSSTPASG